MINMTDMSVLYRCLMRSFFMPVALGFTTASLMALPSHADDDDYGQCVANLTDTGVTIEQATASCAGARFPGALGECVMDVSQDTGIGAVDTLEGCERSRRPDEVADCTIDIHRALLDQPSVNSLENCCLCMLPERYGTCVIDLGEEAQLPADTALDQCIRAGYRPWTKLPRQ